MKTLLFSTMVMICLFTIAIFPNDIMDRVEHGYVDNAGVKLHYATLGEGPLIVMIHGYPDYWYTWRKQMAVLAEEHQVVAVDLRGYNRSDKPEGVDNYRMRLLIGDIAAVIQHFDQPKATVIGHDWGGAIAWQVAIWRPDLVERLVVLSTPHPRGFIRELRNNSEQQQNSEYARNFQKEDAHKGLTAESLASWVTDEAARPHYIEAFQRSDFEAMLNYYKASYPKSSNSDTAGSTNTSSPPPLNFQDIQCPVLTMFGLEDRALLPAGFNGTWDWIKADLTMVSIPGAGHFVQQDAADAVTQNIQTWLKKTAKASGAEFGEIHPEAPAETAQFGQLIGHWRAEQTIRNRDGSWSDKKTHAEWRWYYILEGHAIQDDWISLSKDEDSGQTAASVVGTNIRIYNPKEQQWVMAWIDKNSRRLATFTAVFENENIIMTGTDNQGRLGRNTFHNITENSFDWKKEWTSDNGETWFEVARIHCVRK